MAAAALVAALVATLAAGDESAGLDWVIRDPDALRCGSSEFLDVIDLTCRPPERHRTWLCPGLREPTPPVV